MSTVSVLDTTSWELTASITVDASPWHVYDLISDITRMGEWSPECLGGAWVSGTAGEAGARFQGYNQDGPAAWTSESQVIEAAKPHRFGFSVLRFRPGGPGDSGDWVGGSEVGDMTWTFEIASNGSGCVLTQHHALRAISPFYRSILEQTPEDERSAALRSRKEHLQGAMKTTLERIKAKVEAKA